MLPNSTRPRARRLGDLERFSSRRAPTPRPPARECRRELRCACAPPSTCAGGDANASPKRDVLVVSSEASRIAPAVRDHRVGGDERERANERRLPRAQGTQRSGAEAAAGSPVSIQRRIDGIGVHCFWIGPPRRGHSSAMALADHVRERPTDAAPRRRWRYWSRCSRARACTRDAERALAQRASRRATAPSPGPPLPFARRVALQRRPRGTRNAAPSPGARSRSPSGAHAGRRDIERKPRGDRIR